MFVCSDIDIDTGSCIILDTEDGVEDCLTRDRVRSILNAGVLIVGLTSASLELGIKSKVILQFARGIFGSEKKEYDGFLFKDLSIQRDEYIMYQFIEFNDLDLYDICTLERFMNFTERIKVINSGLYKSIDKIDKSRVNYSVNVLYPNGLDFQVEELSTSVPYIFNIFDALYFLVIDGESIYDVNYISYDEIHIDGKVLTSRDYMRFVYSKAILRHPLKSKLKLEDFNFDISMLDNVAKEIKSNTDLPLMKLSAGKNDLNSLLGSKLYKLSSTSYIPVYSIYNNVSEVEKDNKDFDEPIFSLIKSVNSFDRKTKKIIVNETMDVSLDFYIKYRYEFKPFNQKVFDEVLNEYRSISTLKKFKGEGYLADTVFNRSLNCVMGEKISAYPLSVYNEDTYAWNLTTPYGKIEVEPANYFSSDMDIEIAKVKGFGGIFLCRLTHIGSYWLTFRNMNLSMGTMRSSLDDTVLSNDKFEVLMSNACKNGLSYHDNTICPIGIRDIIVDDNGVNIQLVCITKKADVYESRKNGWGTYSLGVFVMPLIFTFCKCEKIDNYYKIYTLCSTIKMESNVFDNLYGVFDRDTFFHSFNINSENKLPTKKVNELVKLNIDSVSSTLKLVDRR